MTKVYLFEALPLKKAISRKLHELVHERDNIAYVTARKDEEYEKPERTFEEVTEELNDVRDDYRKVSLKIAAANSGAIVETSTGTVYTLVEALELAKQMRAEAALLKRFGQSKKTERLPSYNSSEVEYKYAQFDPKSLKAKGEELEKFANSLSNAIERANHTHYISFGNADKYM
ncbi:hypothetical protein LD13_gp246 [Bacillus phage Bobb]|uniref:Uncharacterized protein n=1 Tax=Bacillus phage Bobb TaxID=1527469 RepID=A0A076G927_9CAUD|nr:hypothetical protein LD13_gp246 [Bacillus phage Bobb]AII28103.1 hypothetical protein [Bacillus phage Bobb]